MKARGKAKFLTILILLLGIPLSLGAQTKLAEPAANLEVPSGLEGVTAVLTDYYYHVVSDGGSEDVADLTRELELRFASYNRLFRFDPAGLEAPLRVRAFRNKAAYDAYVSARLGKTFPGAVYLHFNQAERRELAVHRGSPEEAAALPYQAFIQFFRAFIPNPPAWMRDGFAVYFSALQYDPSRGELAYEENLSWLEAVKALGDSAPPLESIFLADSQGLPDNFQALSWSLVSFFLNDGNADYFRTLTGLFPIIAGDATARENGEAALRNIIIWTDLDSLRIDYLAYLDSRRTYDEFIQEGRTAYAAKDALTAELNFRAAQDARPSAFEPYYYLGLLAYEKGRYEEAEERYLAALERGGDSGALNYALGLNAASDGRREDAVKRLQAAAEASPRYAERAENFLRALQQPPVSPLP